MYTALWKIKKKSCFSLWHTLSFVCLLSMLGSFLVWRTLTEMCAALLWKKGAEQLWFHSPDTGDNLGGLQLPFPVPCYIQQNVDSRGLKSIWIQWIALKIIASLKLQNGFQSFFNLKDLDNPKYLDLGLAKILISHVSKRNISSFKSNQFSFLIQPQDQKQHS